MSGSSVPPTRTRGLRSLRVVSARTCFYRLHVIPVEMPPLRDRGGRRADDRPRVSGTLLGRGRQDILGLFRRGRSGPGPLSLARQCPSASECHPQRCRVVGEARCRSLADLPADILPQAGDRLGRPVVASLHPGAGAISPTTKAAGRSQSMVPLDDAIRRISRRQLLSVMGQSPVQRQFSKWHHRRSIAGSRLGRQPMH